MVLKGHLSDTVKEADRSGSLLLVHLTTEKAAILRHQVWVTAGHYKSLEQGIGLQFVQTLNKEY